VSDLASLKLREGEHNEAERRIKNLEHKKYKNSFAALVV
jgi:hypothetical protein